MTIAQKLAAEVLFVSAVVSTAITVLALAWSAYLVLVAFRSPWWLAVAIVQVPISLYSWRRWQLARRSAL